MPDNEQMKQRVTPCALFGLVCFFLGGICLTGYFLTPGYEKDGLNNRSRSQFSDKPHALPFGIAVMSFGLLVIAIAACNDR